MVKRKLDGAVYESSADEDFHKLYITCERSGGLHLVEMGLMAGSPAVWPTKFGRGLNF